MNSFIDDRRHIPGLDIVRFWAACSVALFHLAFWSWTSHRDIPYRASAGSVHFAALKPYTWFGWAGVETFFVISGVVICASASHATPYQFLRGRIGRLYPAVWICASVTAFVVLALGLSSPTELAADYLRSVLIFSKGPWVDTVYKTLIVEGVLYAIVLGLLIRGWFRHTETVAVLLGIYSLAFWTFSLFVFPIVRSGIMLYFSKNAVFFALGMMIWVTRQQGLSPLRLAVLGMFTCGGALEVQLVALDMAAFVPNLHEVDAALVWLASVAAIMVSVFLNEKVSAILKPGTQVIKTLGLVTYPLYLIHDVVGSAVLRTSHMVGQTTALGLALLVSFAAAYAVVRLEPGLRRPLLSGLDALAKALERSVVTAQQAWTLIVGGACDRETGR